jgi:hypothetical protein
MLKSPGYRSAMRRIAPWIAGALLLIGRADARPASIEEGRPFPEVALPTLDGAGQRSITSFRGKKIVLHVFASW